MEGRYSGREEAAASLAPKEQTAEETDTMDRIAALRQACPCSHEK